MTQPRVLIVEDDPELRSLLQRGLAEEGFEPDAVATGGELLARIESDPPDLLVVDIGLPDADGRDLCQAVRARGVQAPVLFLTARDALPDRFLEAHRALFAHRHEQAGSLRDEQALRNVLKALDIDADVVFAEVASGRPLATIEAEHTAYAASHDVWGVPTFIVDDQAAFVRFMHRPAGDGEVARRTIERAVDLLGWPDLNEFKHTSIPH